MHARILPSGVKVAGPMAAGSSKKQKVKPDLSHKTVQFEGLNGNKCRKWWQDTPDTDVIKKILVRAQVHQAIQLPIFSIRLFESILRTMVGSYDQRSRTSTFQYKQHQVTVSFKPNDFTRVFGIPGPGGRKVDIKTQKLSQECKEHWVKLVSRNLSAEEFDSVLKGGKSRGLW